ncbi:MAG: single-stranded-DNA-specific exonuclease RecJ [Helicobacter sp.]|nr:single-stranded-DNA-specific exonuclease RecJ [Helicobacter sp.]
MEFIQSAKIQEILSARTESFKINALNEIPHPYELKNAKLASQIIKQAMNKKRQILIVGDYDVDGSLGTYIFMEFFRRINYKYVNYKIPNRFKHGYGLSMEFIADLESLPDLIITVDNGVSAFCASKFCAERGIELIITDHHEPQADLAQIMVNPKQKGCDFPFKEICGAFVAWYMINALKLEMGLKLDLRDLLSYVMIATIADVMPLICLNRVIVRHGLKLLNKNNSIHALLLKSAVKSEQINSQDIAFSIAPLINSAGRMGDANMIVEFLLENGIKAQNLFAKLCNLNEMRKDVTDNILAQNSQILQNEHCIIMHGNDLHQGVLGIAASKLTKLSNKNAFVLTQTQNGLKGSARSNGKSDIFTPLLNASLNNPNIFKNFGGHKQAVGLTIDPENLELLLDIFKTKPPEIKNNKNVVFGRIKLNQISEISNILCEFQPFGSGFEMPLFMIEAKIIDAKIIKEKHQQFVLKDETAICKAISFYAKNFFEIDQSISAKIEINKDGCIIREIMKSSKLSKMMGPPDLM